MDRGHSPQVHLAITEFEEDFFKNLLKKTLSHEEITIVVQKLCLQINWIHEVLLYCCLFGSGDNFNALYPLLSKHLLLQRDVPPLLNACVESLEYHMISVLHGHGLMFSDYREHFLELCENYPFTHLLDDVSRVIANASNEKDRTVVCAFFLSSAIKHNDLVGTKYIFSQHKFDSLENKDLKELSSLKNLAIIDFINKNRSECFTFEALNNNYIQTLFNKIIDIEIRQNQPINVPLVEYLIQENCIDIKSFKDIQAFFDHNNGIQETYTFYQIVYLIDHNNYSSMDSFIDILIDTVDWYKYLEYIYKNQDKFQTKPSFQTIFDHLIIDLTSKNLQQSKDKLETLVHRYKCVLNDSHYQYLVKHTDGLTLFGIVPDSKFVSSDYHPLPI
ncbi:hypothetical protein CYY_008474 [Polysphondylium violaceum]|nr:hypothetical protein CYY_008474 [Polysphondylium violaceum]